MKKTLSLFIAVMMVFTLFTGFGNASIAKAGNGPSTQQIVKEVLKARAEYLEKKMKANYKVKKPSKHGITIPTIEIDGIPIPQDVAKKEHITGKNDFVQIAIDCPSEPLISYAKKHGLTLKQSAQERLALMKKNHEFIKNKLLSVGVNLTDVHDMYVAYNGIATRVRIKDIVAMYRDFSRDKDIARIYNNSFKKGNIHIERLYKPVDDYSNPLIGAGSSGVWSDPGVDGTGMYVGVVDTGIDYTHPDFGGHTGITFPTAKVPAGYDFGDNDPDPMDCQGHGTHVSGIIAADGVVKGVAPKAKIVFAKIVPGCTGSASDIVIAEAFDYMADPNNVDNGPEGTHPPVASVNMSFGADYGFVDPNAPDQKAIENCIADGIPVALAAGNASWAYSSSLGFYPFFPDYASIGSPAVTPNCMAVAASFNSAARYTALTELSSNTKYAYTVGSSSQDPVTALGDNSGSGYQYVYCGLGGSASDFPASVSGKIALIQRGSYYFSTKIANAKAAGAVGVIIFNSASGGDSLLVMNTQGETLPAVFIGHSAGEALLAKSLNDGDGTGRVAFYANTYVDIPLAADTMTSFSSWGPPPDLSFKPDITAPGGDIWSTVPVAQGSYANYSGTSMATPHVTACMALVKEAHPNWTPDQIKTVLMNTSKILIDPQYGVPYSPHLMGAGRVDVYNAIHTNATVVNKADNKPYVALGEITNYKTAPVTFTVTVKNNGSNSVTYDISKTVETTYFNLHSIDLEWFGATITTNPSGTITVPAGGSVDVVVTVDARSVPDWSGWPYLEGFVTFTPQGASADPGGAVAGQIHVPYMGFLGKWNDFNENDWQFNPIIDPPADDSMNFLSFALSYLYGSPMYATWPEFTDGWDWYICGVDFNGHLDRNAIAFNPNSYYLEANLGLDRNAQNLTIQISKNGSVVKQIDSIDELPKDPVDWYGWYWYFSDPVTGMPWWWNGTETSGVAVSDGKYSLDLIATPSKIFNESQPNTPQKISFPVSVDRVPPTTAVKVKSNSDGSYTLNWTVSDASPSSGIWGFALLIDYDFGNIVWLPPNTSSYTTAPLSGSNHTFAVLAIDNAMNVGWGHPPTVKVSTKSVSISVGKLSNVSFTATDPDGDQLNLSVVVSPVPEGEYGIKNSAVYFKPSAADVGRNFTFTVIATDPAGYSDSDSFKAIVIKPQDTTPPTLNLPGVNLNAQPVLKNDSLGLKIVATDDSGVIARTEIFDNGILMKDSYGFLGNFNVPLSQGRNTITVKVYDRAGNVTEKTFTVVCDTKAPVVSLSNLPKTVTSSKLVLSGTALDAVSGVSSLTVNGESVPVAMDGGFSATVTLKGGKNTITVTATDKAGNSVTETYVVNYVPRKVRQTMITLRINSPYITVNGISKKIDSQNSKPIIKNGRTLLPIRSLVESLGGNVAWYPKTRQVGITLNGHTILLTIGKNMALVDGIKTPIDSNNPKVVPEIINGRTYLPLRFVAENLGCMIDWDPTTKTISIYYMP